MFIFLVHCFNDCHNDWAEHEQFHWPWWLCSCSQPHPLGWNKRQYQYFRTFAKNIKDSNWNFIVSVFFYFRNLSASSQMFVPVALEGVPSRVFKKCAMLKLVHPGRVFCRSTSSWELPQRQLPKWERWARSHSRCPAREIPTNKSTAVSRQTITTWKWALKICLQLEWVFLTTYIFFLWQDGLSAIIFSCLIMIMASCSGLLSSKRVNVNFECGSLSCLYFFGNASTIPIRICGEAFGQGFRQPAIKIQIILFVCSAEFCSAISAYKHAKAERTMCRHQLDITPSCKFSLVWNTNPN